MKKIDSILVREEPGPHGVINTPLYLSSTYAFPSVEDAAAIFAREKDGYVYGRIGNPTVVAFEEKMAEIEEGERGFAFASGMAAIFAVIMATCRPGDNILCVEEVYGGTHELLKTVVKDLEIGVVTFSPDLKNFPTGIQNVGLIFVETPTNPSLHVVDLLHLWKLAWAYYPEAHVCVDNTFATPIHQRPLANPRVDAVIHSATKYIGGHGDLVGGIIVCRWQRLPEKLATVRNTTGGIMSPFTAFLCLRGLQTLVLRMERHNKNARLLRLLFDGYREHTNKIMYPGFGGMISVEFKSRELVEKFVSNLKGVAIAVSLGKTRTIVNIPALMTHSTYSDEELTAVGIKPGLVRISTGIEDPGELVEEFKAALESL